MSGSIVGVTPWGRKGVQALDSEDRAALEARIPDGHAITVGAARRPGDWTASLVKDRRTVKTVHHFHSIEVACEALLESTVVVEERGGFVVVADVEVA